MDGSLLRGQRHPDEVNGPVLYTYAEDGDGEYVVFEGEEIPEGYEPVPVEELEAAAAAEGGMVDGEWVSTPRVENLRTVSRGGWKARDIKEELLQEGTHENVEGERQDEESHLSLINVYSSNELTSKKVGNEASVPGEARRSLEITESLNESASSTHESEHGKSLTEMTEFTTKEERKRISRNLIDEIRSSVNFKRVKPARSCTSELDEECNRW